MNDKKKYLSDMIYWLHWYLSKAREYPSIHTIIHDIVKEQSLSPASWKKKNQERLRRTLISSYKSIPYYSKLFQEVHVDFNNSDIIHEMKKIPILTKDIIRENINTIVNPSIKPSMRFENATGGSTGTPLKFYQDCGYQTVANALDAYVRQSWGIKPFDRTALIWGADKDFKELSIKERIYGWRHRIRSLNAFKMTEEKLVEFCRILKDWRPPYLMGYSSALTALAKYVSDYGIEGIRFKAIRSTAEVLWPDQKKMIEKAFKSPVYDFYGSREINNLIAECSEERQLHFISTWRYIEIVDEQGNNLPDGQDGYIVVTDLSNNVMPLIRYRNDDIGCISPLLCQCGRPSSVLKKLLGRSTDLIKTPDGKIVHGEFFTHLFYGRDDIIRFQVHQTHIDKITVRIVPLKTITTDFILDISDRIKKHLGELVKVEVEVCKEIPLPPSGKHRFTISDI